MVFTHERMRNKVQENIRQQSARLGRSRESVIPIPRVWAYVIKLEQGESIQQMQSWYSAFLS